MTYPSQTQSQTDDGRRRMSAAAEASIISYPHHHHLQQQQHRRAVQSRTELRSVSSAVATAAEMAACYPSYVDQQQQQQRTVLPQKDYSRPLHVDCSVEYELPNTAKPPAGVRNEPLLMIHPCYFRKIESQRRSPFVNNLPPVAARHQQQQQQTAALKRRAAVKVQQQQQQQVQMPLHAAQYPVQQQQQQQWEALVAPPLQAYCKQQQRDPLVGGYPDPWPADPERRSPDRPDQLQQQQQQQLQVVDRHTAATASSNNNNILSGKYRQYLRAHRLHPYVTSAIPIASTFPQIHHHHHHQQVCYNV